MKAILQDELIMLRALDPADLETMYAWENDTTLWDVGNSIAPYSREQLWSYLQSYDGDIYTSHQLRLMISTREDNASIGTIDFYDFDPYNSRAAIGILISDKFQKKGYGSRALKLTIEYAFNFLGLHQCVAIVPALNVASRKLFDNAGFETIGLMKHWLKCGQTFNDAYIMQKICPIAD